MSDNKGTLERINCLLTPSLKALGFELLGCELLNRGRHKLLRVYLDKDAGINVDDCGVASRHIKALLDVENVLPDPYDLEVSSPGIERPLFSLAHYRAAIGQRVRIRLCDGGTENRRNYTGDLRTVEQDMLGLWVDGEMCKLPYARVAKGHIVLPDDIK